jgi:hypothetical protein
LLINMPSTSIHIPTLLIIEQHTRPHVLGIYTLIARLVLFEKRAIELSQADIMAYDPTLARGPVVRALEKLRRGQWILSGKSKQGGKTTYFPTWGTIAGKTIPWNPIDESPPGSVTTIKVHSQLLDEYIGVMVPHHYGVVLVERVHKQPLLHLHDIGVYLTALVGYPVSTPNLMVNKLIIGDKVQLIP